jgi:hypothetical protein
MENFKIVYGKFLDNELVDELTGEIISCITYKSVREKIQNQRGFYNLKKNKYNDWIIFQYVLDN